MRASVQNGRAPFAIIMGNMHARSVPRRSYSFVRISRCTDSDHFDNDCCRVQDDDQFVENDVTENEAKYVENNITRATHQLATGMEIYEL